VPITQLRNAIPAQRSGENPATVPSGFRPDIEGLRAVAVTLVVLGHVGLTSLPGGYVGVDVFFVISGFLITTLLLKERARTGTISIPGFYARRAVRLLPVSAIVVAATVVAAALWLPATRFTSVAWDAFASTFYGMNWRLAVQGTDYLQATVEPSPLQHLWSLAVEEQFYLVWPLLIIVFRRRLGIVMGVVLATSLAVSVWQTGVSAPWAYFGAHTRAFELAAGALVAIGAGALTRTPAWVCRVSTWGGLAAIVAAAILFTEQTAFPGYAALLPVLGAAAVIAGGVTRVRGGAVELLGTWPFLQVGKLSYGWYLWHWPFLIIGPVALGRDDTVKLRFALAVAALLVSIVSYHLVEHPVRTRPWLRQRSRRGLSLGLALTASLAGLALFASTYSPPVPTGPAATDLAAELNRAADPEARLKQLITASAAATKMPSNMRPRLADAAADLGRNWADQCHLDFEPDRQDRPCVYGAPDGRRTVYLIGDSHAAHWFPGFDRAARERGWKLVSLTKSACQIPSVQTWNPRLNRPYDECTSWRDQVFDRVRAEKPDLLVLTSNDLDNGGIVLGGVRQPTRGHGDDALWVDGWKKSFERLDLPGTETMLLQDTPWPKGFSPECLAENADMITECQRPVKNAIVEPGRRSAVAQAARARGVKVLDPTPWFCTTVCPPVIGDEMVFKDNSHMSATFSATLAPVIGREILDAAS
jgi:peptidoglycan/LPS O-acetylase OafA/YrhL